MNAQTNTADAKLQVGDLVAWVWGGLVYKGSVVRFQQNQPFKASAVVFADGITYEPPIDELTLIERKQEPTHEGGKERTAAARSTSWAFRVGDRVSWRDGVGKVIDVHERILLVVDGEGEGHWVRKSEATVVADAPEGIVGAILEEATPLLLADEPIDLGDVDADDVMVAASLDAASLLVRICAADGEPLLERVTLNGVTWLVDVRPE